MTDETPFQPMSQVRVQRILVASSLAVLAVLLYLTVHHFASALTWAVIFVLSCWPIYRRLRQRWPSRPGASALLMTVVLGLVIVVPLGFLVVLLVGELQELGSTLANLLSGKEGRLADEVRTIPIVGEWLRDRLMEIRSDRDASITRLIEYNKDQLLSAGRNIAARLTRNTFQFFVCMFATYFLFRHGESLGQQVVVGVRRVGGARFEELIQHVRETVRAVVYGLVMTAIAQAVVASLGFWLFGVPFPLLLGSMMFFVSFVPFGPPLVWIPASLLLLGRQEYWSAALMFLYGVLIISTMDNVFRPLFIGQATKLSVLLVFVGVLGGILGFGMVGLFVGPVVIAVTVALWREWVGSQPTGADAADGGT